MANRHSLRWAGLIAATALGIPSFARVLGARASATTVDLSMATLHAAVLTSSRAPGDSADSPYVLVSVNERGKGGAVVALPATGHLHLHRDEAIGVHPLTSVRLNAGDTVRVLISVLEGGVAPATIETQAGTAAARAVDAQSANRVGGLAQALSPLTSKGAYWLGSATLLLTRDAGGDVYWRGLECVTSCKILSGGAPAVLAAPDAAPSAGVAELSGAGATYHMKIEARRAR